MNPMAGQSLVTIVTKVREVQGRGEYAGGVFKG